MLDRSKRGWFTRLAIEPTDIEEIEVDEDEAIVELEFAIDEAWLAASVACSDTMMKNSI